jgi:hypothetical protein
MVTHREAWRRGPGSLAGGIADDGFVDVAGADEAEEGRLVGATGASRGWSTLCRRMLWVAVIS